MRFVEEKYATDLHEMMRDRFGASAEAVLTLTGSKVQWRCVAKHGHRSSWVYPFEYRHFETRHASYLTSFQQDGHEISAGRTHSQAETVEAVWQWLDGCSVESLHQRFSFVDREKRDLLSFRDFVSRNFPELEVAARSELTEMRGGSAISKLWYRSETRSVLLSSGEEFLCANFYWDECELFWFKAESHLAIAHVLKRWLCDSAMPSEMRVEFPWLEIGELADYYEQGNPIEGEFIQSWDKIEQFYDGEHFLQKGPVLAFIARLRQAGFDKKLRAGQSMWTFIVSRSRRHRLRPEQPSVSFDFQHDTMVMTPRNQAEEPSSGVSIDLSERVEEVLQLLTSQPIN